MSDHDLGPALLEQFKALRAFIGREDMLMVSGSEDVLTFFAEEAQEVATGERRCPGGHRHRVIARVFAVPFIVCEAAPAGQVWVLDNRRMPE